MHWCKDGITCPCFASKLFLPTGKQVSGECVIIPCTNIFMILGISRMHGFIQHGGNSVRLTVVEIMKHWPLTSIIRQMWFLIMLLPSFTFVQTLVISLLNSSPSLSNASRHQLLQLAVKSRWPGDVLWKVHDSKHGILDCHLTWHT